MNKEEIDLLRYDLVIEYYKNKDITTRYRRITNNTAIDNEILDNLNDTLFITTLNKYNNLQQENKQLKERIDKATEYIKGTTVYGMRTGKTLLTKYLNDLLQILKGENDE